MPVIALMTDFGVRDYYAAAMKGIILQINPKATIVDISHQIDSQDLFHGAFVLRQAFPYFPAKTIFVAVVDPTVGSDRNILAARYNDRMVVAPDNGLLTLLHRDAELQEIRIVENRRFFTSELSSTFHGRDIFAPVAAHLSQGLALRNLGPTADHIEILKLSKSRVNADGSIEGQIILVDHFGNLISNITKTDLSAAAPHKGYFDVMVGSHSIGPIRNTYVDVAVGEPVALIDSAKMLEVAVNKGSAAKVLNADRGTPVSLRPSH